MKTKSLLIILLTTMLSSPLSSDVTEDVPELKPEPIKKKIEQFVPTQEAETETPPPDVDIPVKPEDVQTDESPFGEIPVEVSKVADEPIEPVYTTQDFVTQFDAANKKKPSVELLNDYIEILQNVVEPLPTETIGGKKRNPIDEFKRIAIDIIYALPTKTTTKTKAMFPDLTAEVAPVYAQFIRAVLDNRPIGLDKLTSQERDQLESYWFKYKTLNFNADFKFATKGIPSTLGKLFKEKIKPATYLRTIKHLDIMVDKITNLSNSQARKFVDTLKTMHTNISKAKQLPPEIRQQLNELAKKTDANPFFANLKKGTGKTSRTVKAVLDDLLIGERAGIDFTKDFTTAEKMSTKTIAALEKQVDALLEITRKLAGTPPQQTVRPAPGAGAAAGAGAAGAGAGAAGEPKPTRTPEKQIESSSLPKVTKKQAEQLYTAAFKLYKAGTKAKLDQNPAKNIAVFKKISQFARESIQLMAASNVSLTKKRMATIKKIADTLTDGFHFESAYYQVTQAKGLAKKLEMLTKMLDVIQTAPNLKPAKNTSSSQLKKYLSYVRGIDKKIRSEIAPKAVTKILRKKMTPEQLAKIIIAYKSLLDKLLPALKTERLKAGVTKADNTGMLRMTATNVIKDIEKIYKRFGKGPAPFYLPLELYSIDKMKKDTNRQIKEFSLAVQKTITTDDKQSANDVLKLIVAIRKIDPQIVYAQLESYKKLLLAAKNKFATFNRVNKSNTYKKLIKLEKEYATKVKFYELKYKDADKATTVTRKLALLEEIVKNAPSDFFKKVKNLKKYRTRVTNQIKNLASKIKSPDLVKRFSNLIELALTKEDFSKHYPKSLKRSLLVPFKSQLNAFKKAQSDYLIYTDALRRLATNLGKKKVLERKLLADKRAAESAGKRFKDPNKLRRTTAWISNYSGRRADLQAKQIAAKSEKERIRIRMGTVPRIVQEERTKINNRTNLRGGTLAIGTEKYKARNLAK